MRSFISFSKAVQIVIPLFVLMMLFHLTILVGITAFDVVPLDFLWGGRMSSKEELLLFELFSLIISGICLLIVLIRAGRIKLPALLKASRIALWLLTVLFFLNTLGNLVAKTAFEKSFSLLTLVLALLCLRIALEPIGKNPAH